jgi:hypothetical protein
VIQTGSSDRSGDEPATSSRAGATELISSG